MSGALSDPLGLDDGTLDGLSGFECFLLGVEWAEFRRRLLGGAPFSMAVDRRNLGRLVALCERYGRYNESHPVRGEEWLLLVGGDRQ